KFPPFHLSLHRVAGCAQVVLVIFEVVGGFILRSALPLPEIINDEVPCQPHQPILQVTLFRIVLIERTIDSDENFLCQVLSGVSARGEAISEIVDTAAVVLDDLFPRSTIACAASSD